MCNIGPRAYGLLPRPPVALWIGIDQFSFLGSFEVPLPHHSPPTWLIDDVVIERNELTVVHDVDGIVAYSVAVRIHYHFARITCNETVTICIKLDVAASLKAPTQITLRTLFLLYCICYSDRVGNDEVRKRISQESLNVKVDDGKLRLWSCREETPSGDTFKASVDETKIWSHVQGVSRRDQVANIVKLRKSHLVTRSRRQ